jgi:hypothetical protein
MKKFPCKKCNKEFNRNEHLIRHINKKNSCLKNIPIIPNIPEYSKNGEFEEQKDKETNNLEKTKCKFCLKCYSTKYNLNKHLKNNVCKFIKCNVADNINDEQNIGVGETIKYTEQLKNKDSQIDILIEQNCEMQKQNKELQKMILDLIKKETKNKTNNKNNWIVNKNKSNISNISNTLNTLNTSNINNSNINNGTVNNNITIQFGKEDLSEIDNKYFINLIKSNSTGAKIITDLVKMIHFNEDYPQFQNVYMSDLNRGRVVMYDGVKWSTITNGDKIIPDLIEKAVSYSHTKDNQLREEFKKNPRVIGRMDVIKKHTGRCDGERLEELKEQQFNEEADNKAMIADSEQFIVLVSNRVKELVYNEKDIVIKRKEKLENKSNKKIFDKI